MDLTANDVVTYWPLEPRVQTADDRPVHDADPYGALDGQSQ